MSTAKLFFLYWARLWRGVELRWPYLEKRPGRCEIVLTFERILRGGNFGSGRPLGNPDKTMFFQAQRRSQSHARPS